MLSNSPKSSQTYIVATNTMHFSIYKLKKKTTVQFILQYLNKIQLYVN